jgi:hypothetical protein
MTPQALSQGRTTAWILSSLIYAGSGGFPGLEPVSGSCPVAVRSTNLLPADRPDASVAHEVMSPRHEPYELVEVELPN